MKKSLTNKQWSKNNNKTKSDGSVVRNKSNKNVSSQFSYQRDTEQLCRGKNQTYGRLWVSEMQLLLHQHEDEHESEAGEQSNALDDEHLDLSEMAKVAN